METTKDNQNRKTFEYLCYALAGICALLHILSLVYSPAPTPTRCTFEHLYDSFTTQRWEIAFFGWLIVGRITALINKKTITSLEQQAQIPLNASNTKEKVSHNKTKPQETINEDSELYNAFMSEMKPIYDNVNNLYDFKVKAKAIILKYNDIAKTNNLSFDFSSLLDEAWEKCKKM